MASDMAGNREDIKKQLIFMILSLLGISLTAQPVQKTFELRYFTNDSKANGETDFKGKTEWFNTGQRVQFLNQYADYASRFFGDPNLDRELVSDQEIDELLKSVKPQPLTNTRQTIPLNGWKAYGYKSGQDVTTRKALERWQSVDGTDVLNGILVLRDASVNRKIDSLFWRFKFEVRIKTEGNSSGSIALGNGHQEAIHLRIEKGQLKVVSDGKTISATVDNRDWVKLKFEGDFTQKRFNLFVNDELLQDYIPMANPDIEAAIQLSVQSEGKVQLDDLFIFNHIPVENDRRPYYSEVVLDDNFEEKTPAIGWQRAEFDDHNWETVDLPAVHGGLREKEEDYYLRKKIQVGDFERATLQIESLDPGGEVWVNNQVAAVLNNRYPAELDISKYLEPNSENLIAVRVKPYQVNFPMAHTPTDPYVGWFLGRTKLLLSNRCMIQDVKVTTKGLSDVAMQSHKIQMQYPGHEYFEGNVEINYYPWFPEEGDKVATFSQPVRIRPLITNEYEMEFPVPSPQLWRAGSPNLYRVELVLKDEHGKPVDDYVTTIGIRTIEQKNGDLFINGKHEMLNGAQIMGFRTPIETIAKYHRCAPYETVAEETLMLQKMNANMLRVHVHAEQDTTDGINDPRYAELADQLGIYLIWSTGAWTRTAEVWNVDFDGYPKYMKQVYNHPSIVIWEAANHPKKFKKNGIQDTHDYVQKIVQTIAAVDRSRLISPTTFWTYLHYGNYEGTIDYLGNQIRAVPEYMHPLVTRGGQDAYTGYGREWTRLRNAPDRWAGTCLDAKDKAYFNFEHEESAGQPNWELSKGKPWYLLQSYEWEYEEGSIGRKLSTDEWKASQAWQAFSAWESMKKQVLLGYDGFSWCSLRGGPNMGTYQKPLIDNLRHPKLAFYANRMVFQKTWAGSNNVDVVYGPDDQITPVINHLGEYVTADITVQLKSLAGKTIDQKMWKGITLAEGHSFTKLDAFQFKNVPEGIYVIQYEISK